MESATMRGRTGKVTVKPHALAIQDMSEAETRQERSCVSCGISVTGTNAARFKCPDCGTVIFRCSKCRKQINLYECPDCGFRGP